METCGGLNQKELKRLFNYHSDGYLIWRARKASAFKTKRDFSIWTSRIKGRVAGSLNIKGYIVIRITRNNKAHQLRAHRLIYLFHKGYLPNELDHINRDRSDNRIENLREATSSNNGANCKIYSRNSSGYKGVCRCNKTGKWAASLSHNKKRYYLGAFKDIKDAARSYNEAAIKYHGEFAKLNEV